MRLIIINVKEYCKQYLYLKHKTFCYSCHMIDKTKLKLKYRVIILTFTSKINNYSKRFKLLICNIKQFKFYKFTLLFIIVIT